IEILERNHDLKGFFTINDGYVLREVVEEAILEKAHETETINVEELAKEFSLDKETILKVFQELVNDKKLDGSFDKTARLFHQFSKIKKIVINSLQDVKELDIETLNDELNLNESDLVINVERVISLYAKQLRGLLTKDKKTFIKEETMTFRLMELLENKEQVTLKELEEETRLDVEQLRELISKMLELGLISGTLEKDVFKK
ncbi:MAG: hypothetical protein ACXQS8_07375, partial [Candidatus Helarchaeales archaeon]